MTIQKDLQNNEKKYLHKFIDFANKRVLEIGCGEGRLTWQYAAEIRSVVGVDLDIDALRVALIDRSSDLQHQASFTCAHSIHLPFQHDKFDAAILAWSF